ncbi:hypothetical protein ASG87_04285 [Frateuria sp. Soil773]|uniref:type IV pilin protein n=1 Tax=Frateuria sp. Soil773 TaxID=1736407 RepID=UPI0006F8450E|nr:type IV pilin protein [Frateuria sp. Soil773]KRE89550.1 hypothetical protein ASG87_04285 [Frateuria sp. Soil773]
MDQTRGFTLLELMIVVAIIAILAAIAVPAYGRYAFRSRRADGQELLLRLATAQERHYATFNKYGSLSDLGFASLSSDKGYYTASIPASSSSAFTATATPAGDQVGDKCGNLSINNVGNKTFSGNETNGKCW